MSEEKGDSTNLNESQKKFCEEYIFDFNATRAYNKVYPKPTKESARRLGSILLTNIDVKAYIAELQADLAKTSGISRLKVLKEYEKMAFTSIAHLHDTWTTRKEFEDLTEDQKSSIAEIQTRQTEHGEEVKIKLHDKRGALESISRMLGYNEPEKVDVTTQGEKVQFYLPDNGRK